MIPIGLSNRPAGQMTGTATQTPGQLLYQQASQSAQPEVLVKSQFQKSAPEQRSKLADQFINTAGREGVKDLSTTPDGQHLLAVVYDHAGDYSRQLMRQVHEEQGNTAVDYTGKQTRSDSGNYADDPLNVSDSGVEIGPRISVTDYTAMTSGIVYGLVENTVIGIAHMGAVVGKESQELKNVDNLEYAGIDEYGQDSGSPGLTIPSMEEVDNALKGHIEATNKALMTAKDVGDYFGAGKAISNDPMLQMTGLGEMAIFGSLAKIRIITKLDSFAKNDGKLSGANGSAGPAVEGKAGRPESSEQIVDVTNGPTIQGEVDAPNGKSTSFNNKYPEHEIGVPKILPNEKLKDINGTFNYVVKEDGRLVIGREFKEPGGGHIDLSNGNPVLSAGQVKVVDGEIKFIDNSSGHFEPVGQTAIISAENGFKQLGFDVENKYIFKKWVPDPKLKNGGAWRSVDND